MLETVVGRLRQLDPSIGFRIFSYYPEDDRALCREDPAIRIHNSTPLALVAWMLPGALLFGVLRFLFGKGVFALAPSAIRDLGRSEALVDLAGVAFIDGREKFLPFNLLTLAPAWLLGVPVVKMPQAVGPFRKPINRLAARWMLPRCRMVWARGGGTRRHLEESGFPGVRFRQGDDIAFNHSDAYSLTDEGGEALDRSLGDLDRVKATHDGRGIVGICPSSVVAVQSRKAGGNYEQVLTDLCVDLTRSGFAVVLFPNATRAAAGDAERNNDLPVIRRVRDAARDAGSPVAMAFDLDMNTAQIKHVIRRMDAVLVSRFHAMVGALALQVPPAVLGWSHKYAEVMARFGLEHNVMDYKALSKEELQARVLGVFEDREAIRLAIAAGLPEVKEQADLPVRSLLTPSLGADLA